MHLDALLSQLNDVVSNSSSPATALSLTAEAEDFSTSQAVTYVDLRELPTTRLALHMCLQQTVPLHLCKSLPRHLLHNLAELEYS